MKYFFFQKYYSLFLHFKIFFWIKILNNIFEKNKFRKNYLCDHQEFHKDHCLQLLQFSGLKEEKITIQSFLRSRDHSYIRSAFLLTFPDPPSPFADVIHIGMVPFSKFRVRSFKLVRFVYVHYVFLVIYVVILIQRLILILEVWVVIK